MTHRKFKCDVCEDGPCFVNNTTLECLDYNPEWKEVQVTTEHKKCGTMSLREVMGKSEEHDSLKCHAVDGSELTILKKNLGDVHVKFAISNLWQILPPESKVLSANQAYLKSSVYKENYRKPPREYIIGYGDGTGNGQNKERKNLQPLIDAVGKYTEGNIEWHESGILEAYENIKPLE